jgi:uncharacterized protein involved in outer membrane biogenesis
MQRTWREPMKKAAKRTLFVLVGLLVVVVGLAALAPLLLSTGAVRRRMIGLAEQNLNGTLAIDDLHVSWFGGLKMRGLRLQNPPGFSQGSFLACGEASGGIAWGPLLRGVIDLRTIHLERPEVRLERSKEGVWNFAEIVKKREAAAPSPGPAGGGGGGGRPGAPRELPSLRARLLIHDAHVELRDDLLGTRTDASRIDADLSADLTAQEPTYSFSANVPAVAANQSMGPLLAFVVPLAAVEDAGAKLSGTLALDGSGSLRGRDRDALVRSLEAKGHFKLENGTIQGSPLASRILEVLEEPSLLEIRSLDAPFEVRDGAVRTEGITVSAQRVDLAFSGKTTLDGGLDFHVLAKPKHEASGDGSPRALGKLLASAVEVRLAITGTVKAPKVVAEGVSANPSVDPKDLLEKGAGEALRRLKKKG